MTDASHRTLVDTSECVRQMCADANAAVGCHLEYVGRIHDGRHHIRTTSGSADLLGTAEELFRAIDAFACGYASARADSPS